MKYDKDHESILIQILLDTLEDWKEYSVHNDDVHNEEIIKIEKILIKCTK